MSRTPPSYRLPDNPPPPKTRVVAFTYWSDLAHENDELHAKIA